jgi:hypothetical protein
MFGANRALIFHRHQRYLQIDQNKIPHDPRQLRVPFSVSKTISEAVVRSAQTVHLSCVKISTIFKRTESSFHLSLVTRSPIGCVQNDLYAYGHSVQTMHLSCIKISTISNELSQASTWASSPRSTIGCVQNNFRAYGMFSTNHAPIFHRHQHYLQMDQNKIPHDPRHLGLPSGASKMISKAVVRSAQTVHLSCVKISTIFERSESSFHLSLVT